MRKTIHKWFWAWDYEKEEKWLNEMSTSGLQLAKVGFCKYVFDDSIEDKYIYRLELLNNVPSSVEGQAYINFLEGTGVEYVDSLLRWAYFRRKASEGKFEIYSDIESKIKHYKRIVTLFLCLTPINVLNSFSNLNRYIESRNTVSITGGLVSLACVFLLGIGSFKVLRKINKLKKERIISE